MLSLATAAVFFVGWHLIVSGTGLRDRLVERLGQRPFQALFALGAAGGLVWMSIAFARAPQVDTWGQLHAGWPVTGAATLLGLFLLVAGVMTANPSTLGATQVLERADLVHGVLRITRHPGLMGIGLWALGHFVVNGDWAAHLFFGPLAALAILGPRSIDRKYLRREGEPWARFMAATPYLPFAGMAAGDLRRAFAEIGWRAPIVALGLAALVATLHRWLFGVPAIG